MFVANAMDVGGAEPALYPLLLDGRLELRDSEVEGLFLCGGEGVAAGDGATAAVSSKSTHKLWLQRGPMPIKLLWNCGIIWVAVGGREERQILNGAEE